MGFLQDMLESLKRPQQKSNNYLRSAVTGSLYRVSDVKSQTSISDIRSLIRTMRALAEDSQVSTALNYYATDATTPNTSGDIIWAVSSKNEKIADIVNTLFKRWKVNSYARDHILELATVGNLYIPTTDLNRELSSDISATRMYIGMDQNDIPDNDFDIIPSHKIDPEDIVHIWSEYKPFGYIYDPESTVDTIDYRKSDFILLPETSVVHFSLGGVIGDYSIEATDNQGNEIEYDIQFAKPLMTSAVQPTQTLNLLEDATVLSSLIKTVRFIAINCKEAEEEDEKSTLLQIKNMIEQQLSLNSSAGDAQSFINPQSPNNLIYLPMVNGASPIEITDMNMRDDAEGNDKLLDYYQDKKLSVLGIPKEAMNFSSAEGLGGAGSVMSQRSALYANALQRIETAYINGWTDALNMYFQMRNLDRYVNEFELHMNPILTEMSTIQFEKRDSAISQAAAVVDLLQTLDPENDKAVKQAVSEILTEALPKTAASVPSWKVDMASEENSEEF